MTITDRIEVNPRVMLGKPVIRGTRISGLNEFIPARRLRTTVRDQRFRIATDASSGALHRFAYDRSKRIG
jgi:hypothetical protein